MEKILSVAVDINDSIELADTAEERFIEEGVESFVELSLETRGFVFSPMNLRLSVI
jgi:hypothetical protein